MQYGELIYSGKAKSLFRTSDPEQVLVEFRDDATAFNGEKVATLTGKGAVNNQFNAFIMSYLQEHGIATHFIKTVAEDASLMQFLEMIPVECVVRNRAAGSICKRLGLHEDRIFSPPLFEFFLKDDELGDPLVTEAHILALELATADELKQLQALTLQVNDLLVPLFAKADLILVDFKLEFGRHGQQLLLGDEFSPDGCRVWDATSLEKLDKDRFRQDLGDVVASYAAIAERLGITTS